MVSQGCLDAIKQNEYWRDLIPMMLREKREANHLLDRYKISLTESRDEEPIFFRRLYSRLSVDLENAQLNLRNGVFMHSKVKSLPIVQLGECINENPPRVAVDVERSIIVMPHRRHVEMLKFNHTQEGIGFKSENSLTFDRTLSHCCAVDVKGDLVFTGHRSGSMSVWLWSEKKHLLSFLPNSQGDVRLGILYVSAIKIKGNLLMIGSSNGYASMWDTQRLQDGSEKAAIDQVASFEPNPDHYDIITAMDFHGNRAAAAQCNGRLCVWSIQPVQRLAFYHQCGTCLNDCISVLRGLVVTAHRVKSQDTPVCRLWNIVSDSERRFLPPHMRHMLDLQFPNPPPSSDKILKVFRAPPDIKAGPCSLKTDWETILILATTTQSLVVFDFRTTAVLRLIVLSDAPVHVRGSVQAVLVDATKILFKKENEIHALDFVGARNPEADVATDASVEASFERVPRMIGFLVFGIAPLVILGCAVRYFWTRRSR